MTEEITKQIESLGICIIIPTYNNAKTLKSVIDKCLKYTPSVLVVNDGCTDGTSRILDSYKSPSLMSVQYLPNRGKGYALKEGFEYARMKGYRYALTIDADGQHNADDIPNFVQAIRRSPDTLVVGCRNIEADNMPKRNTFANKFSNFWFRIQTLQTLTDTQSGFRLYPLRRLGRLRWLTARYEAELELLVFAAWQNVELISVSIQVYYPKEEERVSHFHPYKDFLRISLLNTILCFLAVVYGIPRILYYRAFKKK